MFRGHSRAVTTVCFNSTGYYLASGSKDRTIRIWDVLAKSCLQMLHGHNDSINSVSFGDDDMQLASGASDGSILVWDMICHKHILVSEAVINNMWTDYFADTATMERELTSTDSTRFGMERKKHDRDRDDNKLNKSQPDTAIDHGVSVLDNDSFPELTPVKISRSITRSTTQLTTRSTVSSITWSECEDAKPIEQFVSSDSLSNFVQRKAITPAMANELERTSSLLRGPRLEGVKPNVRGAADDGAVEDADECLLLMGQQQQHSQWHSMLSDASSFLLSVASPYLCFNEKKVDSKSLGDPTAACVCDPYSDPKELDSNA